MKNWRMIAIAMALVFAATSSYPQGGLGRRDRGNPPGNSGSSSSGQKQRENTPPKNDPPRSDPGRRSDPPQRNDPPKNYEPPRRNDPPRNDPPKNYEPPRRNDPPRNDPPKNYEPPRRNDPPRNDPPRNYEPPRRNDPPRDEAPPRFQPPINPPRNDDPGQGSLGKGKGNGNSGGNQGGGSSGNQGGSTGSKSGGGQGSGSGSSGIGNRDRGNQGNERGNGGFGTGNQGGGNQGGPPLGRVDNPPRRGGGSDDTRSGSLGKLGNAREYTNYGSNNNAARDQNRKDGPVTLGRPTRDILGGSLPHQVRRESHPREVRHRSGYWAYNPWWCDNNFRFGWYIFDPYGPYQCVSSPWYYYPHLPGYISYVRVRCLTITFGPWYGVNYGWRPIDNWGYDYGRSALDYAVDDIERAFERQDHRALGRVVPSRGDVHIWVDGAYQYTMDADAFYDLMEDNVMGTRTVRYQILSVRTYRNEAEVQARHEYNDPWGRRVSVYHWYRLERERDGYVIRNFGTSDRSW